MKWPLRNCGATYLRDITDTVQTVQYSDSQCTLYTVTILARVSTFQLVACRALLYSTTTFYTVRVLFRKVKNMQKITISDYNDLLSWFFCIFGLKCIFWDKIDLNKPLCRSFKSEHIPFLIFHQNIWLYVLTIKSVFI